MGIFGKLFGGREGGAPSSPDVNLKSPEELRKTGEIAAGASDPETAKAIAEFFSATEAEINSANLEAIKAYANKRAEAEANPGDSALAAEVQALAAELPSPMFTEHSVAELRGLIDLHEHPEEAEITQEMEVPGEKAA